MSTGRPGPSIDSRLFSVSSNSLDVEPDSDSSSLSSYAGSAESYHEGEFSPVDFLNETITSALDPSKLDRVIVIQAQTSGIVHAKSKEIQQLQEEATKKLAELRTKFTKGINIAKQVSRDLEWAHRHTQSLIKKTRMNHPIEYTQAEELIRGS